MKQKDLHPPPKKPKAKKVKTTKPLLSYAEKIKLVLLRFGGVFGKDAKAVMSYMDISRMTGVKHSTVFHSIQAYIRRDFYIEPRHNLNRKYTNKICGSFA